MPKYIYSILIISNLFSQVDYSTQIQPIFDNSCISCHIDGGTYFGGLDLSSYSEVMEGGSSGNTIVPFDHSSSELYQRITLYVSDDEFMPQNGSPLPQSDIDLIAQWIDEGALQDNNNSYPIEGRWLIPVVENDPGNTMYEFLDGLRYTYYCTEDNGCDTTYWNSLDTSDAIPNPNPYTFSNDTLSIDVFFGNIWQQSVTFECDGNIVSFGDTTFWSWWRVGLDTNECEDQQLKLSSAINSPEKFRVNQNYPNPFNPITNLTYELSDDAYVSIMIYDMLGNVVNNLVNASQSSGYKSIKWNATNNQGEPVSAGLYLYTIEAGEFRQTKKMILLK